MISVEQLLRAIKNKIKAAGKQPKPVDPLQQLVENGNVIIGSGSEVGGMSVFSFEYHDNFPNVVIGKDCHILGTIELNSPTAKVIIGDRVSLGPGTKLFCRESITIESDVLISWGCTFIDTNAHSLKSAERMSDVTDWKKGYQYKNWEVAETKGIIIKGKSWIGFNSIITKGVVINEGTIVGCGSVVTKSTEAYTVVGGNPAMFIKNTV